MDAILKEKQDTLDRELQDLQQQNMQRQNQELAQNNYHNQ